jgi:hypothetical protein
VGGLLGRALRGCWAEFASAAGQQEFEGLHQIPDEMETVGNLEGVRSRLTRSGSILGAAIPADDADTRMRSQPASKGGTGAVRQEINDRVALQVD